MLRGVWGDGATSYVSILYCRFRTVTAVSKRLELRWGGGGPTCGDASIRKRNTVARACATLNFTVWHVLGVLVRINSDA